jgi:hypothetical protein
MGFGADLWSAGERAGEPHEASAVQSLVGTALLLSEAEVASGGGLSSVAAAGGTAEAVTQIAALQVLPRDIATGSAINPGTPP